VETPTLEAVRLASPLLTERYPEPAKDEDLQQLLDEVVPVVASLTCRAIGPEGTPGDEVPDWLRPVAVRAIALKAEGYALGRDSKSRGKAIRGVRLRSFTAGPYSESYFGPDEAARAKVLDPDPAVNEVLWTLATEDCRARWLALWSGTQVPATAIQAVDWGSRTRVLRR
jgi:hypothetical protein